MAPRCQAPHTFRDATDDRFLGSCRGGGSWWTHQPARGKAAHFDRLDRARPTCSTIRVLTILRELSSPGARSSDPGVRDEAMHHTA